MTHRLGILNYLNPHRMDMNFCLDLRQREDRIVMKMIVHMSVIEPGENVLGETFRWDRLTEPMPGWEIKQTWFREDGLPLKVRYDTDLLGTNFCDWLLNLRAPLLRN